MKKVQNKKSDYQKNNFQVYYLFFPFWILQQNFCYVLTTKKVENPKKVAPNSKKKFQKFQIFWAKMWFLGNISGFWKFPTKKVAKNPKKKFKISYKKIEKIKKKNRFLLVFSEKKVTNF